MQADRRARLSQIISLFKSSGRGWTVHELAVRFNLSERQIRKDLCAIIGDPNYAPLVRRYRGVEYLHKKVVYKEGRREGR